MKQKTDKELAHGFGKMVKGISPLLLEKDQLSDTQNMMPGYGWEQRRGQAELTATPVVSGLTFKSLTQFRDLQGHTDVILAHTYEGSGGEDLYQGSALPPNAITWTKKYDLTPGCTPCQWANIANTLLIANSKDFLIWRGNQFYPTAVWKYNVVSDQYTIFADELFDNDTETAMPLDGLNIDENFTIISEQPLDKVTPTIGDANAATSWLIGEYWNGMWTMLKSEAWSNMVFLDDDCDSLSGWSDEDVGNGVSTQEVYLGRECFKFDSLGQAGANMAARQRDVGTFADTVTFSFLAYHDKIGTQANQDCFEVGLFESAVKGLVTFCSDGIYVHDGAAWEQIDATAVPEDEWILWTIEYDFSTPAAAKLSVSKNGVPVFTDALCALEGAFDDGTVYFRQRGGSTNDQVTYVTQIAVGNALDTTGDVFDDGTSLDGKTLAQSGDVTWTAPGDEVQTDIQGIPGFAYKFSASDVLGNPTSITGISVHAPMAPVRSVWDGFYEFVGGCYVNDGTDNKDYTAYVNNGVESQFMNLAGVTTTDKIYIGFPSRVNKIVMYVATEGKNASAVSISSIKYHNTLGVATSVGTFTNTTKTNGATFSQKGYLAWADPGWQNEKMTIIGGDLTPMYWYEIIVSAALDDPTSIYYIQGVPVPRDPDPSYGVFAFKRRAWQIAPRNKENTVRFSSQDLPNVWVGRDSGYIKFGERPLWAAGPFYNETVLYADTEMWMLQGNSPSNFGRLRLSSKVGISAPKSLIPVEVGVMSGDNLKIVLTWQFFDGFWMFDGVRIQKISAPDIDSFFDPDHDDYINPTYLDKTYGEYDFANNVALWTVYSGATATAPTKVIALHFPSLNYGIFDYGTDISAILSVISDKYYIVGGGHSDGRFYQLDSGIVDYVAGTATAVTAYIITKDEFLSLSSGLRERLMSVWLESQEDGGQIELYQMPDGSKTPQLVAKKSMTVMGKIFQVLQKKVPFFPGQKTTKMKIQNQSKNARMKLIGQSTTVDEARGNE
jgi:hypothetical protein